MTTEIIIETKILEIEDTFLVQGINFNICAEGITRQDAISNFQQIVLEEILLALENNREPLETFIVNSKDIIEYKGGEDKKFFVDLEKFYSTPILKIS